MHTAALKELAKAEPSFSTWQYTAIEFPAEQMPALLPRLHELGFAGLNLTIPHKVDVLPLLEAVDPEAEKMGAVNTLVRTETGYRGFNTDGFGIIRAVRDAFDLDLRDRRVLLLGAGGASRAIAVAILNAGAARLTIVNRSRERLEALGNRLRSNLPALAEKVDPVVSEDFVGQPVRADLVINATALGLKPEDPAPLEAARLPAGTCVYDTTYGGRNALARECGEAGLPYADGLSMLVWQGVRSLEIWTGQEITAPAMKQAAREALEKRSG